jgi:pSer/pThr/pTyr-binding forkhead associated (FHA) protein
MRTQRSHEMQPRSPSGTPTTGTLPITGEAPRPVRDWSGRPDWVIEAREELALPGRYLAYEESGRQVVVPLAREWTRIGRSLAADVRFDDATVSRRHALIVVQADGVRVLDDRSLNGVYVNGERVEWRSLVDGDEITVGRHSLWFLERSPATVFAPPAAALAD